MVWRFQDMRPKILAHIYAPVIVLYHDLDSTAPTASQWTLWRGHMWRGVIFRPTRQLRRWNLALACGIADSGAFQKRARPITRSLKQCPHKEVSC